VALKEQRAYKLLAEKSAGVLNCKRIENQNGSGMSDFVVQGHYGFDIWLEIKALDDLPLRLTTCPLKGAFEKGQLPFLREKISWGGHGFVALRANDHWWLFDPTMDIAAIAKRDIDHAALAHGTAIDIVAYLDRLRIDSIPYAKPNYRTGTLRRKNEN